MACCLKGIVHIKKKIVMSFQTYVTFFLLWTIKDILRKFQSFFSFVIICLFCFYIYNGISGHQNGLIPIILLNIFART